MIFVLNYPGIYQIFRKLPIIKLSIIKHRYIRNTTRATKYIRMQQKRKFASCQTNLVKVM